MAQLRQDYQQFQDLETEIVAIAPDTFGNAKDYFQKNGLLFVGLADEHHDVYDQFDIQSRALSLGQRPGLFIIDKAGVVRYAYLGTQQWQIPENDVVLAQLSVLVGGEA